MAPERGAFRDRGDRRRTGGSVRRVPPEAGRTPVRDPGRERAHRRQLADPLRLVAPLHPALGDPAPGVAVPGLRDRSRRRTSWPTTSRRTPRRFDLPVADGDPAWNGLSREGERFVIAAGERRIEADDVIVATGAHRDPRVPVLSSRLDPEIVQLHVRDYRDSSQLREGGVLVVGAGNSGADVSLDVVGDALQPGCLVHHRGHIPVDIDTWVARNIALPRRQVHRSSRAHDQDADGPQGEGEYASQGDLLVRVKPKWLEAAGVERRRRRRSAVRDGKPILEDGRVLDVTNVIWCTGFGLGFSWIDLPIFGEDGAPMHDRGVVMSEPGLLLRGAPLPVRDELRRAPRCGSGREVRRAPLAHSSATAGDGRGAGRGLAGREPALERRRGTGPRTARRRPRS